MGKRPVRWQHATPQREVDHEIRPTAPQARGKPICAGCGKPITKVGPDEGPEMLKALLRL